MSQFQTVLQMILRLQMVMYGKSWSKLIGGQAENGLFWSKMVIFVININPSSTSQSLNCF